jgi:hypothetical protein
MKIVFSNKLIDEHADFVSRLQEIGISKKYDEVSIERFF